ncbi:MAG: type VII secretion protein EccCa [Candidatus Phosphoribacter baldrii]
MATRAFARRPRLNPPPLPDGEFLLEPPPEIPRAAPPNIMSMVLPVAMILMVVGFIVVGGLNTASLMMGAMMLMMTVGMIGSGRSGGPSKAQLATDRNDYLRYLATLREEIAKVRDDQRSALTWVHPTPSSLWSLVGGRRMWERRHTDDDFVEVRLGAGPKELASPLRPPQTGPINEIDPICAVAMDQLLRTHANVDELPISVRLDVVHVLDVRGDRQQGRAMVRAAICQLATFHGHDALVVAAVVDPAGREEWDWLKWLPHNHHPTERDSLGPVRMVASSLDEVAAWLADELTPRVAHSPRAVLEPDQPHVVVVVDGRAGVDAETVGQFDRVGVTLVDLTQSVLDLTSKQALSLVVSRGLLGERVEGMTEVHGSADQLSLVEADALVRRLAPFRLSEARGDDGTSVATSNELPDMLGLGDVAHLDPDQVWRPRSLRDLLRVPIGVGPTGETVELDLKESALGGMGPHGLVIGATGSGKSELLRTLVLALAVTHAPDTLNLVLVDFKGGATFAGLHDLPHTAAVITNLQDDLAMVDRMYDALSGEMNRRQEMLRDAGNLLNVRDYDKARQAGANLEPLPWLLVVCDEFSELLAQKPDFAELFVAIGRLGRSLGIHLLLASQRLEEGRLRGLDSHLSYRVGLKTFTATESRTVLGVPDAFELPPIPGSGFLKFDTTSLTRFKASYVSGAFVDGGSAVTAGGPVGYARPVSFVSSLVDLGELTEVGGTGEVEGVALTSEAAQQAPVPALPTAAGTKPPSLLDVIVGRLHGHGLPAHDVWLPPLRESPTVDRLLPPLEVVPGRGLGSPGWAAVGPLRVPIGIVDLPYEQRRDSMVLDFSGGAGNGVVVGGPQSGKSTALRTIITSLALTHTPREVQVYAVDLGGGSLVSTQGLPHVGGVATRARPDYLRRLIAEVAGVVTEREARFRRLGVESMASYRTMQRAGDPAVADDPFGDVFLVIDGWGALREEFDDLEGRVTSLAARGLSFGVHVLISAARWQEVRPAIKDSLGTRIELRLGDPLESEVDRKVAALVPANAPGRGVTAYKRQMLLALPRIDAVTDAGSLATAYQELVRAVRTAWEGPVAPAVRTLPERLELAALDVSGRPEGSRAVAIGVNEEALATVFIDVQADAHFIYLADVERGKTNFLKVLAAGVMDRYTAAEVRLLVVDYRRTMLGFVPKDYLAGYAPGAAALTAYLGDLVPLLQGRLAPPDVTAEQLRDRSWWSGPEVFVLVDDYDMVATGMDNPLTALRELLPHAKDIGLHVIVARSTAGASRALFDPLLQSIRELGSPGFVGTGSTDEGALLGPAKPQPSYPSGRGILVTRRQGAQLIQIATVDG